MVNGWDEKFWVSSCFSPPPENNHEKTCVSRDFQYLCRYVRRKGKTMENHNRTTPEEAMARDVEWLLERREEEGWRWTGRQCELVELVYAAAQTGLLLGPRRQPPHGGQAAEGGGRQAALPVAPQPRQRVCPPQGEHGEPVQSPTAHEGTLRLHAGAGRGAAREAVCQRVRRGRRRCLVLLSRCFVHPQPVRLLISVDFC